MKRIFLVDDSEDVRDEMVAIIREVFGSVADVETASSKEDALSKLPGIAGGLRVAVVDACLDPYVSEPTGLDVCEQIKRLPRNEGERSECRVILFSRKKREDDPRLRIARAIGSVDFVVALRSEGENVFRRLHETLREIAPGVCAVPSGAAWIR